MNAPYTRAIAGSGIFLSSTPVSAAAPARYARGVRYLESPLAI